MTKDTSESQALMLRIRHTFTDFDKDAAVYLTGVKKKGVEARKSAKKLRELLHQFQKTSVQESKNF